MNKKGVSLTEILVSLALLGILSGIATVSYHSYTVSTDKKALLNAGRLFVSAVSDCVAGAGGWQIWRFKKTGESCDNGRTVDPCKKAYPCKAGTGNREDLKKKLDWTCPAILKLDDGDECYPHTHSEKTGKGLYTCLKMKRVVSGKTLQTFVRVSTYNPSVYQILCGEDLQDLTLNDGTCKRKGAGAGGNLGQDKDGNPTNKIDDILKENCKWKD